jgi:hypothetical protein
MDRNTAINVMASILHALSELRYDHLMSDDSAFVRLKRLYEDLVADRNAAKPLGFWSGLFWE